MRFTAVFKSLLAGAPLVAFAGACLVATPARAADDEDLLEEDETELDNVTGNGETGEDLLGGEEEAGQGGPGQDTEAIYRAFAEEMKGQAPDEELQGWESYLAKYPKSLFAERIKKHMEELEDALYGDGPNGPTGPTGDAKDDEIDLAVPLQLDPVNPRQMLQVGFEWGLPSYINLYGDYTHPIRRDLAAHVGIRHRYTGWRLETGARWAFVKSTRTQTVVSLLVDVHLNTIPAYPVFRPILAAGKKFGRLDLIAEAGVEVDTRGQAGVRPIGGINATLAANDTVKIFLEGNTYQQWLDSPKGTLGYRFEVATFGLKFLPAGEGLDRGDLEVNIGATVPVSTQFWMFHYGSIMGQVTYFFPGPAGK